MSDIGWVGTVEIHRSARRHGVDDDDITHAEVEALADEAERGYDLADLIARRGKRGRPTLGGAGPSTVESVRLDPELNEQIAARAEQDGVTTFDVIREALRRYLHASCAPPRWRAHLAAAMRPRAAAPLVDAAITSAR